MLQESRYTRKIKGATVNVSIIASNEKERAAWEVKLLRLPGFHLDKWYVNGESAIQSLTVNHPDVVLLNSELPDMSGIECLRRLTSVANECHVILYASPPGPDDLVLLQAIKFGASGFLTVPLQANQLEPALRMAFEGGLALHGCAKQRLRRLLKEAHGNSLSHPVLSRREDALMDYVLVGAADKEIAARLGISVGTVHSHFTNIFKKLKVSSRKEAARKFFGTEHLLASEIREHRLYSRPTSNRR